MSLLGALAQFATDTLAAFGYTGLFLLMVAESMVLPIPSEAVLPFAGFLASDGRMTLLLAFLVSITGTLVGSWLSYALGAFGVRPILERWGKYVFVTPHHLDLTHAFFEKRGATWAVFLSRFVPVVRHLISIPAGSARMPLGRFTLATAVGGGLWDFFLIFLGFQVGRNYEQITAAVDAYKWWILVVALLGAAVTIVIYRRKKKSPASPDTLTPPAKP